MRGTHVGLLTKPDDGVALPLLNQPIYVQLFGSVEDQYLVAKWINDRGFYVGCRPGLGQGGIDYMIDKFREFFSR